MCIFEYHDAHPPNNIKISLSHLCPCDFNNFPFTISYLSGKKKIIDSASFA